MEKIVRVGTTKDCGDYYAKIELGKNLSICGVEGPKRNGDARGGCGQCKPSDIETYAPGWSEELVTRFVEVWDRWHRNYMRPDCKHQRRLGWADKPIDPSKPTNTYGKHFEGQAQSSWNMLAWVSRKEHPEGLLSEPCPECGYKYGSAWLFEEVPTDIRDFLASLPDTDKTPAWV